MLPLQLPELSAGGGGKQSLQALFLYPQPTANRSRQVNIATLQERICM